MIFNAKNCKLEIHENVILDGVALNFACDNSYILIQQNSLFKGAANLGLGCSLVIGAGLTVTGLCYIEAAENTNISIGEDCMFASLVQIRTDDAHPIFDISTKERVNKSRSIQIGKRVWLGYDSILLSGTAIGDGSVVGIRSVVKGTIPKNCICAGIPARVIKEGISWERSNLKTKPPFDFPHPTEPINDFR